MNGMGDWHRRRARAWLLAKKFRRAWLDAFRATLRLRPSLAVCDAKRLCAHQPALVPFLVGRLIGTRRGIFLSCFQSFLFLAIGCDGCGVAAGRYRPFTPRPSWVVGWHLPCDAAFGLPRRSAVKWAWSVACAKNREGLWGWARVGLIGLIVSLFVAGHRW